MTNIELYNECKRNLLKYLELDDKKLIIISGPGSNGKTTLLNELKTEIESNKYAIIDGLDISNITYLKKKFNFSEFNHLILVIIANMTNFTSESDFHHINMSSISF